MIQDNKEEVIRLEGLLRLCIERLEDNDPYFSMFIAENSELHEFYTPTTTNND